MAEVKEELRTEERKNLATCTPREFLKQTNRIRKSAERWMTATDIVNIRNRKVEGLQVIPADDAEEAARIRKENAEKIVKQRAKNLNEILDSALEEHIDETLELLALACFVEPKDVDKHKISFYLRNLSDIFSDADVLGFFTSLAQLEQTGILSV